MIIQTRFNYTPPKGEKRLGLSLAVPNRELTIRDILKCVQSGQPIPPCGLDVYYDAQPEFEQLTHIDKLDIDLTDIAKAREQYYYELRMMEKGADEYRNFKRNEEIVKEDKDLRDKFNTWLTKQTGGISPSE